MPDQDIFDKLAAKSGGNSGDIFDRLAAKAQNPEQNVPDAAMQAHQQMISGNNLMPPSTQHFKDTDIPVSPSRIPASMTGRPGEGITMGDVKSTLPVVGGTIGEMFGGVPGAALGGIAGEGVSQMYDPSANPPKEMLKQGAIMGGAAGVGKYAIAPAIKYGGKLLKSLAGKAPEEIAELRSFIPREDAIQAKVLAGRNSARATASAAYPDIKTPVDVAPAQMVAKQVSGQMVANNAPTAVANMAEMPGAQQLKVIGMTDDLGLILRQIQTSNQLPFREAQTLYSSLGEAMAKGKNMMPGEVYSALKVVRETIGDSMKAAAQADGKLTQYTAAQKGWSQYMQDWWNPGAPMKPLTSAAAKKDFVVLKQLISDNGGNITKTMEKYGIDASDVRALQRIGKKSLQDKIAQAAELNRMGESGFQGQAAKEARVAALKKGAALAGGGGLIYDLLRHRLNAPTPSR